ncbi:ABC transporter permease [Streptomyces sp. TR06-5]|uniref:ABC transporter permease n=1 Tax=Streptomyces sp. TR06-5 TaxID=3385976 RepID=UPI0039A0D50B
MSALPAALRPRGLTWSVLSTHRAALRTYAVYVVLCVGALVWLQSYGEEVARLSDACEGPVAPCVQQLSELHQAYRYWRELVGASLAHLAVAVAGFAGATLVARERESGTAALSWTQSVTPARWLAAKLALPALVLVTSMTLLTAVNRWVWTSGDASGDGMQGHWHDSLTFLSTGPAATAHALFALVLGAVVGLLLRRTLPALGITVGLVVAVQMLAAEFRGALWPTRTVTGPWPVDVPPYAHILESGGVTATGERFGIEECRPFVEPGPEGILTPCIEKRDAVPYLDFHPFSHYWPLQWVETGILLAAAGLLTFLAFRLLRRRLP